MIYLFFIFYLINDVFYAHNKYRASNKTGRFEEIVYQNINCMENIYKASSFIGRF